MTAQDRKTDSKAVLRIDYLPSVNYSMMNSGIKVCNSLVLENADDSDWTQLSVRIAGQYIKESVCRLDSLMRNQSVQITTIKIEPDFQLLCEITEAVKTSFVISVQTKDILLCHAESSYVSYGTS